MRSTFTTAAFVLAFSAALFAWDQDASEDPIQSRVVKTDAGERILVEEILVEGALEDVWKAYTTEEGWTAWAAPKAKVDLRVGGTIRTQYDAQAEVGDAGTNTLYVVNYVPLKLLTLRADLQPNWPEIMKEDADNLSNVVLFESLGPERTRVTSYGIGYRDRPEYDTLLDFFLKANRGLYQGLKRYVEEGERSF